MTDMTTTTAMAPAGSRALRLFLRNPNAVAGMLILATVLFAAIFADLLAPGDPLTMVAQPFLWPGQNPAYPLGTDMMGRDVLAGIIHGSRVSLAVGLAATATSLLIGTLVGAITGYYGGWIDRVGMNLVEIVQTPPNFLLLVVIVAIWQPNLPTVAIGIGAVSWPTLARLVRGEFRAIRGKEFVTAAHSLGFSDARIIFREVLPNALPPVVVTSSVLVATAILMESALSFLGLSDPNRVSWGSMIGEGREMLRTAWYLAAVPGLCIFSTVLAFNLIGDGLNDAMNPRLAGRE